MIDYGLGGFYQLTFWLGSASETQVHEVLSAPWSLPNLDGCYLDATRRTTDQARLSSNALSICHLNRIYGQQHCQTAMSLPVGQRLAGTTKEIRQSPFGWILMFR
jgi:hypothetical protein